MKEGEWCWKCSTVFKEELDQLASLKFIKVMSIEGDSIREVARVGEGTVGSVVQDGPGT